MRKLLLVFVAFLLLAAGCGGGSADSCEGVADNTIDAVQAFIDTTAELTLNDLVAFGDDDVPGIAELESKMEELETKATELSCSDEEMGALLEARADQLEPKGFLGEMIAGAIAEGDDFLP
jgi:hypothetical protein